MLEASARNLLFFDTILNPQHDGVPHIPLEGILRELEELHRHEGYVKLIDNEMAAIRLNDIEVNYKSNTAILLITYADKRGADPVFANLEKGTLRSEPKLEGEGVAVSAHLGFNLNRNKESKLYPTILEDVPGIGRTLLEPFLRSAFRQASSYKFKNKNGNQQSTWPVPTLIIKQSESLAEALSNGGYITQVDITKYTSVGGFDKIEETTEKNTTTRLKVEGKPSGEKALDILNSIMKLAKRNNYVDMRVKWVNSYKKTKRVNLGTARADAGDALYGRVERVNFDHTIPQCSERINDEMRKIIIGKL